MTSSSLIIPFVNYYYVSFTVTYLCALSISLRLFFSGVLFPGGVVGNRPFFPLKLCHIHLWWMCIRLKSSAESCTIDILCDLFRGKVVPVWLTWRIPRNIHLSHCRFKRSTKWGGNGNTIWNNNKKTLVFRLQAGPLVVCTVTEDLMIWPEFSSHKQFASCITFFFAVQIHKPTFEGERAVFNDACPLEQAVFVRFIL